ncbi:MAG: galactokinase [Bdellovibrionales bacterium]
MPQDSGPYEIYAKSPTRVDLAGGTLDLWPIYAFLDNCYTVNVAIDIFTHCIIKPLASSRIVINVRDLNITKEFSNLSACLQDPDERFSLIQKHIQFWKPTTGFEITTWSESPVGGGLGGSSSLSVTISGAFAHWLGRKWSPAEWVETVHNIEAQVLKMPTGTQDYYPPILGGLNSLHYRMDACHIRKHHFTEKDFKSSFLLIYTGKPHHSGMNNWQVLKECIDGNTSTMKALQQLQKVSEQMHRVCDRNDWGQLKSLLNQEFEARVAISKVFSSPEIERLQEVSLRAGAEAVKICGAGGGGCVLVWCPPSKKESVAQVCRENGFQVLEAQPTEQAFEVHRRGV